MINLSSQNRHGIDWQAILEVMPDPAVALDGAGVVLHHNALTSDPFPKLRVGQPISNAIRNPELLAALDQVRARGERIVVDLEDRVPVRRRFSAILAPIGQHGLSATDTLEDPPVIVIFRDMSTEERLARMRADFIAYASHELRTPLASLRGFVETLQGPARDDARAREKFLGIMAAQATRMTRLIDDLLSLSRAEMRVHLPPVGHVDLNEVASFVTQALEPVALQAKITLNFKRLGHAANVNGDREELVQVLQNLIQNAIKYGKQGGRVEVRIEEAPQARPQPGASKLLAIISDDGPGIAPEHLPRLTERFYRVNPALSRERGGTGLGLAIVKNLVQRHRGELKIASEQGRGSTFTVTLDAAKPMRPGETADKLK